MATEHRTSSALVPRDDDMPDSALELKRLKARRNLIHSVMRDVLRENVHFGIIPGTKKPSLLKAGAETLAMTFNLAVELRVEEEIVTQDEVSYRVLATLRNRSGSVVGSAHGTCSTREEKYRWRAAVHENEYRATEEDRRRIVFDATGEEYQQVRQDPGSQRNTMLQMASKRGMVAATRTALAASDIFSPEREDDQSERDLDQGDPDELRVIGARTIKADVNAAGKPWKLYGVKFSNGREATTFSEALVKIAEDCQKTGALVTAQVEKGDRPGRWKLEALAKIPPTAPPASAKPAEPKP